MPDEPVGAGPAGEPEGDLTARLRRLEERGTPAAKAPARRAPWPVSEAPVPPPPPTSVVEPLPPPPMAEPLPPPAAAADEPALPRPREADRLTAVLLLVAVLLLAAAAGLGAAALVEQQADPTTRDAWISGALAAGIVLVLAGIVTVLRRPRVS